MVKCIESLKSKLRGLSTFQDIYNDNDVIVFICATKDIGFKFESRENIHVSMWNMKKRTVNTYQNHLDPVQYLEKVKYQVSISAQMNAGI